MRGAARIAAHRPDVAEIFAKAEAVRSPDLDYAVDFQIETPEPSAPGGVRRASYTMVAHGKNASVVLMVHPEGFFGGTLLIADGSYWLLLPRATKPLELSGAQILQGDVSNGDLARANLLADYTARLDGEERVEGEPCWRLELTRTAEKARYSRIRCFITKKGDRPKRFEYFGMTGVCVKTVRYGSYTSTPLGVRPLRLDVDDSAQGQRTSTMTFSDFRAIDTLRLQFTPAGIVPFRDAAMSRKASGFGLRAEELLAALPPKAP